MRTVATILALIVLSLQGGSQSSIQLESPKRARNTFYLGAGTIGLLSAANINAERFLSESKKQQATFWLKANVGKWVSLFSYSDGGPYGSLGITILAGNNAHHLETDFGLGCFFNKVKYEAMVGEHDPNPNSGTTASPPQASAFYKIYPVGSLGYRYQKSNGLLLLRTGVGYPDAFYLGVGISF